MNTRNYIADLCGGDRAKIETVEAILVALATDFLSLKDYTVLPPTGAFEVETPAQFRARLRISTSHFARRLAVDCPSFEIIKQGATGRIAKLRSNPALDRHMQPVQKHSRAL